MPEAKQSSAPGVDYSHLTRKMVNYVLEGIAVAVAAFALPKWMGGKALPPSQIGMIAMVAIATFAILDYGSPSIAGGARQGAGFGIGARMVGFP